MPQKTQQEMGKLIQGKRFVCHHDLFIAKEYVRKMWVTLSYNVSSS